MALIKSLNGSSFSKMMLLRPPDFEGVAMPKRTQIDFHVISIELHPKDPNPSPGLFKCFNCEDVSEIVNNDGGSENYRSKLVLISYTQSPDTKGLPISPVEQKIKKLLERDSITWTEEGNGQIMVIRIDEINPKRLSFAKKPTVV